MEVVFHISSIWVKIRLLTENQLPRPPRTALIVMSPGGGVVMVWCLKLFWVVMTVEKVTDGDNLN